MRSETPITILMSCSTSSTVMPSARISVEQLHEACGLDRVHAGHRLVEQQELRPRRQRHRHLQQPQLAVGQRGGDLGRSRLQPDEAQDLDHLARQLFLLARHGRQPEQDGERPLPGAQVQADGHVVVHGLAGEHAGLLERAHHAECRNGMGLEAVEARGAIADLAGRRLDVAGDGIEGGGLAGAVGADEGEHLAAPHLEGDAVDGGQPAEADGEPLHDQLGAGAHRAASAAGPVRAVASARRCHQLRNAGTMPSGRK